MRKTLTMLLVTLMAVFTLLPVTALAANESFALYYTFDKASYEVGDTVTVQVKLDRTDSTEAYDLFAFEDQIVFDKLYLDYTGCGSYAADFRVSDESVYFNGKYDMLRINYNSLGAKVQRPASLVLAELRFTAINAVKAEELLHVDPKVYAQPVTASTLDAKSGAYTIISKEPMYTVGFAGGEGATGDPPADFQLKEAPKGYQFTLPQNSFAVENGKFLGWHDGKTLYQPGDTYTMGAANVSFTARWQLLHSVSYTGGEGATGNAPETTRFYAGDKIVLPTRGTLVRSGYTFAGWSWNGKDYQPGDTVTMPDRNVTFSALWKSVETGEVVGGTTAELPAVTFTDVSKDAFYYDAVLWAVEKGVTSGTSDTTFSPEQTCTRAQTVTFLWRAMGEPEPKTTNNPFTDVAADAYYYKAVLWAVEKGVTNGTSDTTFSPNATVTRGQAVTFQWRAAGGTKSGAANPFTDVADGAYYYNAVLWAVEHQVTQGTSASTFSPDSGCTRGQIVTFLHRYLAK